MSEDSRLFCNWPLYGQGFARITDSVEPEGGCRLPIGFKGWIAQEKLVDEFGHEVGEDNAKLDKCDHRDTPEWKAAHQRAKAHKKSMRTVKKEIGMADSVQAPEPVALPEVPQVTASVGVPPAPSAADLSKVAADAGGGVNGILMALIAVVGGGGAIWKYLQSSDKAKGKQSELDHEVRMKELELKAASQQKQDDNHNECKVARQALASKIEALEGQLSGLHSQVSSATAKMEESSLSVGGGDDDEIEEKLAEMSKRISKVETRLKAKK